MLHVVMSQEAIIRSSHVASMMTLKTLKMNPLYQKGSNSISEQLQLLLFLLL